MSDWKDKEIARLERLLKSVEAERDMLAKHVQYYERELANCRAGKEPGFVKNTVNKGMDKTLHDLVDLP